MLNETDPKLSAVCEDENSDEISILDLLLVIAAGKKLIIALTFFCGIAAGLVAFLTTETFTATAVILPPQQSSSASALLGQLGGLAGQSLGIKNPADAYIGILESRTVADLMIRQFGLQELYEKENLSDTRNQLKNISAFKSTNSGMITISVTNKDPQLAADMANAYVEILKTRNNTLAVTEAAQRRMFFEQQWDEEKNRLAEAEWDLKSFQEQRGLVRPESQMDAVIQTITRLQADITAAERNLARLLVSATKNNPEVQRQEAELTKMRSQLENAQSQNADYNQNNSLIPTSMIPEAGLEYTRKLREVRYREAMYDVMARQYEAARLDEANESPLIQVVDDAITPERKSAPKRSLYILAGLLLGGMFGVFIVFLRHAANNPSQAEKFDELKYLLSFGLLKKK